MPDLTPPLFAASSQLPLMIAAVVAAGVAGQWVAWRLRMPAILLLLAVGIAAGPLTGLLEPDQEFGDLLLPVVSLSVAVILFEGGLGLDRRELRRAGLEVWLLVTVGVAVTWVLATLGARVLLGLDFRMAVLLGAILTVTGPTVIGPLLAEIRPVGRVGSVLRAEGVLVDPIGAALAVLTFEAIRAQSASSAVSEVLEGIGITLGLGAVLGLSGAALLVALFRRYLIPDHLQSPLALAVVLLTAATASAVQDEAGLFAVTVMGVALALQERIPVRHIIEFKENLRVLLIGGLFVTLAARVSLDDLGALGWQGAVFVVSLILVARPIAVAVSTFRSRLAVNERLFTASLAPRGIVAAAVASVFALELEAAEPAASQLVPATFAVVIGTIAVYSVASPWLARRLGLADPSPRGVLIVGAGPLARLIADALRDQGIPVLLTDVNEENVRQARLSGHRVFFGSVTSEEARQRLDLTGIGTALALTDNDELNTLAANHFVHAFGRSGTFQLTPVHARDRRRRSVPTELEARAAFGTDLTYARLEVMLLEGHRVVATRLTERFGLEELRAEHGDVRPLFLHKADGRLVVYAADGQPNPQPGDVLISLSSRPPNDRSNGESGRKPRAGRAPSATTAEGWTPEPDAT